MIMPRIAFYCDRHGRAEPIEPKPHATECPVEGELSALHPVIFDMKPCAKLEREWKALPSHGRGSMREPVFDGRRQPSRSAGDQRGAVDVFFLLTSAWTTLAAVDRFNSILHLSAT